jgi:tryptophan synthase alpha chain
MLTIQKHLTEIKRCGNKSFIPYVTYGYPTPEKSVEVVKALDRAGVSLIEVGLPFSDPVADGPVIEAASVAALKHGVNLDRCVADFAAVKKELHAPLAIMTYYNLLFGYGLEKFFKKIKGVFDGIIIPDILPDDADEMRCLAEKYGIGVTFFVAPTTQTKRLSMIDNASTSFVYYVSVTGTTGARTTFDKRTFAEIAAVGKKLKAPVCAGFGIATREHVQAFEKVCDGVIVGSAIIKKITECAQSADMPAQVAAFARSLMGKD